MVDGHLDQALAAKPGFHDSAPGKAQVALSGTLQARNIRLARAPIRAKSSCRFFWVHWMRERFPSPSSEKLVDNLNVLQGIRKRVALGGKGPREVVVAGNIVLVSEFFSDSVSVVDWRKGEVVRRIELGASGESDVKRKGEMLFNDATICHQTWQNCASCHPDGRTDGLRWDLLNDGIGNPKMTRSLVYAHQTPPAMTLGVRETAEGAVRSGLRNILFAHRPETEAMAIDEHLKSLKPVPSPYLVKGQLSPAARRGKKLFESQEIGCGHCHSGPYLTDQKPHAVGTGNRQDGRSTQFDNTEKNLARQAELLGAPVRRLSAPLRFVPGGSRQNKPHLLSLRTEILDPVDQRPIRLHAEFDA
jgi:hypothetical protein